MFATDGAGNLIRGSATSASEAEFTYTNTNVEVGFTLTAGPVTSGHQINLDIRLNQPAGGASSRTCYRLQVQNVSGALIARLNKRIAGTITAISADYPVSVGDRLAIRAIDDKISLIRNLVTKETVTNNQVASGGYVAFTTGASALFGVTDIYVESITGTA
ncbi:hypothetical protein SCB71_06255 [Herbiconiux sp. KACC 21604]|uniref:hypothetical protein n=1 Tax=unclassified Herbiconiux TaxID=2618217 RepID=UPI001492E6E3|nr:hypothetical protein [Herbiconiux sp. SALV-R1]QJU52920.1 hypothetical protein HL652_04240 [Herbiconiux sp. SALV-R1]WPO87840.1 hypothetical protein SCB71_06255 [Herbiconiux sp. KACC 21604]